MDYRKFLGREEELTLPYFGGTTVEAKGRRLRLESAFEPPGWYRFTVKGRAATPKGEGEPQLDGLPAVRGHFLSGRLVREGGVAELMALMPAEEPARFAPITARRWHDGQLIFDTLDFEADAEGAVREALADGRPLSTVKGAVATLRAAYAYAVLEAASRRVAVPFAPAEVRAKLSEVADGGVPAAEAALAALKAERELALRELAELERRRAAIAAAQELEAAREARRRERANFSERVQEEAAAALEAAGARLEQGRLLDDLRLEVVFRFMGERFISVVDAETFRVIDSGICLGHPPRDDLVTLESLCSVIKEAIETGALVILRVP